MSKARKKFKHDLVPEVCEYPDCNYDFFVARHRIKPGKVGGKYIPGNVIGLCPNHHVEADLGKIPQFELFQLVHQRIQRTLRSKGNNGHTEWVRTGQLPVERITYIAYTPNGLHRERKPL